MARQILAIRSARRLNRILLSHAFEQAPKESEDFHNFEN